MIINTNSRAIKLLNTLYKRKHYIQRKEKLLNLSAVYSTIVFNLANCTQGITQHRIASLNKLHVKTVNRLIQSLVELGFLKNIQGRVINDGKHIFRERSTYEVTDKRELTIFIKCSDKKGDFNSLEEFFQQFGKPEKKRGRGKKLWYNCPTCEKNHCVSIKNDKAFCTNPDCNQGYSEKGMNWFDFYKSKAKSYIENIFFRNKHKKLIYIL